MVQFFGAHFKDRIHLTIVMNVASQGLSGLGVQPPYCPEGDTRKVSPAIG